jgi:hypothetical protein
MLLASLPSHIFEQQADIGVQCATIAFERQCVVSSVFDDLSGRYPAGKLSASVVTIVPLSDRNLRNSSTAALSRDLWSVAIWASTRVGRKTTR